MRSELFASQHAEQQINDRWAKQSSRMLRTVVAPDQPMLATKGAMVAYQGNVEFRHQASKSVAHYLKKAVSGEDAPLMRVQGQGEVFFARGASEIFLVELEGPQEAMRVNGSSLLAFDGTLDYDVSFLKSAAGLATGSGLFNLKISGHGTAAICRQGQPMILQRSTQPTFVDPQAVVCWSANLKPTIKTDITAGTFFGRPSAGSLQPAF